MNDEIRSQAAATSRSKTLGRSLAWWGVALIAIAALTSGRVLAGDVVILAGGDRLEGKLFKETSEAVFLDIGYDVIKIPL